MTPTLPYVILLLLTAICLLVPVFLWRSNAAPTRAEGATAVLRDKLAQVSRDRDAGLIGPEEAAGAEAEISRALINAARDAELEAGTRRQSGGKTGIALVAGLALGASVWVYQANGAYEQPNQPLAQRPQQAVAPSLLSEHDGGMMSEAIVSLRRRLESDPGNAEQWLLLARSYYAVGAYGEAAEAFARLIELVPSALELRGDHAEALVRAQKGLVDPRAAEGFEIVLSHQPGDPRAQYYLGLRDAQQGEPMQAVRRWIGILETAPADAPYRPAVLEVLDMVIEGENLDREALDIPAAPAPAAPRPAAPGPSAADIAAAGAMPDDEQLEMIRGMVGRLETRLAEEQGDIEGWLRLARSRMVLGEPEAGVAALERALAVNPGNAALTAALADLRGAATR